MRFPFLALGLTLLAIIPACGAAQQDTADACLVSRVVDGDTLYCRDGRKIRLIGMDTPEMSQAELGPRARRELLSLAPVGTRLRVELDVDSLDQYGRVLAYLWRDTLMLNQRMVEEGWAMILTIPPNVRYAEPFRQAQERARSGARGFWAGDGFACAPGDHRKRRC